MAAQATNAQRVCAGTAQVLLIALALAGCSGKDNAGTRGVYIYASEPDLRASLAGLAKCPSPLTRLRIAHPGLHVAADRVGSVVLGIPGTGTTNSATIRFRIDFDEKQPQAQKQLTWSLELDDDLAELELGEGRLLNPPKLAEELASAISAYANYLHLIGSNQAGPQYKDMDDRACRSFGRVADALAVTGNPELRQELTRQKHRDALGWLFSDNYKLQAESMDKSNWEVEQDFQRDADPYGYGD